jgi:hypothetical protein
MLSETHALYWARVLENRTRMELSEADAKPMPTTATEFDPEDATLSLSGPPENVPGLLLLHAVICISLSGTAADESSLEAPAREITTPSLFRVDGAIFPAIFVSLSHINACADDIRATTRTPPLESHKPNPTTPNVTSELAVAAAAGAESANAVGRCTINDDTLATALRSKDTANARLLPREGGRMHANEVSLSHTVERHDERPARARMDGGLAFEKKLPARCSRELPLERNDEAALTLHSTGSG